MEDRSYKNGEIIYKEGDLRFCMYKVLSGKIAIYSKYNTPDEVLITELDSGKIFGEMEMLETFPRITTAISLSDDTVLNVINYDEFGQIFKEDPDVIVGVLNALSKRTMHLLNEYMEACNVIDKLENEMYGELDKSESVIKKYMLEYLKVQKYSSLFDAETTPLF